jgi:hypothetical protein
MSVIEQGKNTSFQWDSDNMDVINRFDLHNSSPSSVINDGVEALGTLEDVREMKRRFDRGRINLGELLDELDSL